MLNKHKSQKLEKDHLYKNSIFVPDWGMETPVRNWKVHELVNKCRSFDEAIACLCGTDGFDSIVNNHTLNK